MTGDSIEPTLYDRIGGEKTVEALVDVFYERVLDDDELKPFFEDTSMDKLRRMQHEFFAAALDGPVQYTGRPLSYAHQGLGIKPSHIGRFVGHLLDVVKDHGLESGDVDDIISRINTYADEIVGGSGLDG